MKIFQFELFALAAAVQNLDDNQCDEHRACWSAATVKYPDEWPECNIDTDCNTGHYCLEHMWEYNNQIEAGKGCWRKEVCAGGGTFKMF